MTAVPTNKSMPAGCSTVIGWVVGFIALLLIMLVIDGIYYVIASNAPVSLYCLGAALGGLVAHAVAKGLEAADAAGKTLLRTVSRKALEDLRRAALIFAGATAAVWIAQVGLNLYRDQLQPSQALIAERRFYELAAALKPYASLSAAAALIGGALAASVALRSYAPLVAVAKVRKWLSTLLAVLAGATMFGFVAVDNGDARYDFVASPIRAQIAANIAETVRLRKDAAALRWAAAEMQTQVVPGGEVARRLAALQSAAQQICAKRRDGDGSRPPDPAGCDWDEYARIALWRPPAEDVPTSTNRYWVPEFTTDVMVGPTLEDMTPLVAVRADRPAFGELSVLLARTRAALNDAAAAESAVRGVATKALAKAIGNPVEGLAGALIDAWRDALLSELATEGQKQIEARLADLRTRDANGLNDLLRTDRASLPVPDTRTPQQIERFVADRYRAYAEFRAHRAEIAAAARDEVLGFRDDSRDVVKDHAVEHRVEFHARGR